jgi:arabinose-5-phosphate isomerase
MSRPEHNIDIIGEIGRVLDIEIEGLQAVRSHLGHEFVAAVNAIARCQGHVFVAGVGKSGIIANKIAATMRSTGTPATFLHAVEALHGDLGMVHKRDVVIAVGKSGETLELNSLLRVLRKNGTFIIAITSNAESAMASLSDIVLDLHVPREACPLNLAPTTSTTVTLAIGDAIAVTLMKLKDISAEDFARHHPAGQLGARLLLTVADVMKKGEQNPLIPIDHSIKEMLARITESRVGAVSVVDERGALLGLVTDYDIRKTLESDQNIFALSIRDIMNTSPAYILSDAKAMDALEMMRRRKKPIAVLPVLDSDGIVVGMIHVHDLIAAGL